MVPASENIPDIHASGLDNEINDNVGEEVHPGEGRRPWRGGRPGGFGQRSGRASRTTQELPSAGGAAQSLTPGLDALLDVLDAEEELEDLNPETSQLRVYDEEEAERSRNIFFGLGLVAEDPDAPEPGTMGTQEQRGSFGSAGLVAMLLKRDAPEQLEAVQRMQAEARADASSIDPSKWVTSVNSHPDAGTEATTDMARLAAVRRKGQLGAASLRT